MSVFPDENSAGLLAAPPAALRYEHGSLDPGDVSLQLVELIAPRSRVLDVGCGTGVITDVIRSLRSASVIGIEPDPTRVQRARARGLEVHEGVLTAEFLRQHERFDVIVFADVLEHLPNPAAVVLLAKEGLKPGGSVVISVPNVAHWFVRSALFWGSFDYEESGLMDATHLRWFTRQTIRELLERLGFEVTALRCTVNIGLPSYSQRAPWRWMRPGLRRRLVGRLAALWPGLFGCQHIVRATLPQ